jgi:hypothetical protein
MPKKVATVGIKRQRKYRKRSLPHKRSVLRTMLFAGITIILSAIIMTGIGIYNFLNAPFSSAHLQGEIMKRDGVWGKENLNLLVIRVDDKNRNDSKVNALGLANIDLTNKRYNLYSFPLEEDLLYSNDHKGNLRDIISYVKSEDKNIDFVADTFFRQFAVRPDGYILLDTNDYKEFEDLLGMQIPYNDLSGVLRVKNTFKMPAFISMIREKTETNLTLSDLFSFLSFIKNTSETSSSVKEISKYGILDPEVWDAVWNETLSYENVKKEHVKVLVLNGSNDPKIPGLATWGARAVENIGSTVLDTENSFYDFNETTLITSDKDSHTVKELAAIFNVPYIIDVKELDQNESYNPQIFRSDVTLVVIGY